MRVTRSRPPAERPLSAYSFVSSLLPRTSYRFKLLAVAGAGIHGPLLTLGCWLLVARESATAKGAFFVIVLGTLATTAVALTLLHALLAPLVLTSRALQEYVGRRELMSLPTGYDDEAGRLMAAVRLVVHDLERALREAQTASLTDVVTGAHNRRYAEERLAEDLKRVRREGGAFTFVLIDLDDFKQVNDAAGHQVGDHVLRRVAHLIELYLGPEDWTARWGGDEFVMVIQGDAAAALDVVGRTSRDLKASDVSPKLRTGLSASFGLTEVRIYDTRHALFDRADHAVYESKRRGRGEITFSPARSGPEHVE